MHVLSISEALQLDMDGRREGGREGKKKGKFVCFCFSRPSPLDCIA